MTEEPERRKGNGNGSVQVRCRNRGDFVGWVVAWVAVNPLPETSWGLPVTHVRFGGDSPGAERRSNCVAIVLWENGSISEAKLYDLEWMTFQPRTAPRNRLGEVS